MSGPGASAGNRRRRAHLLVDGLNVIGARPDGWWRDRQGAMRALVAELEAYAAATGTGITVVFDGPPFDLERVDGAEPAVVFATGSARDAADDEIERIVSETADPREWLVVTSDRELRSRVEAHGAAVESAGTFRRRLDRSSD